MVCGQSIRLLLHLHCETSKPRQVTAESPIQNPTTKVSLFLKPKIVSSYQYMGIKILFLQERDLAR